MTESTSVRHSRMILVAIVVIAAALRLYAIGQQSMWIDEADIYLRAARPTISQTMGDSIAFPDPPAHHVLLHYWLTLGRSDANARLPSALFGIATVVLTYFFVRNLFGIQAGLLAAGLLAINPFHVWYSQEARMYSMYAFFGLIATMMAWRLAVESAEWRDWLGYGAALSACAYTHTMTVFLGLAHAVFLLYATTWQRDARRFLTRAVVTAFATAILATPIAASWIHGMSSTPPIQADKPAGLANLGYVFFAQSVGFSFGPSLYEIQANPHPNVLLPHWKSVVPAAIAFTVVFLAGLYGGLVATDRQETRRALLLLLLVMVVPPVALFAIDVAGSATINPRHAITSLVPYVAILAYGLTRLRPRTALVAGLTIVVLSGVSLGNYYANPRYAKEDARSAAAYLSSFDRTDATALVMSYELPVKRYYDGPIPVYGARAIGASLAHPVRDGRASFRKLLGIVQGHSQFFYIDLRQWHSDPNGYLKTICDATFERLDERRFHRVTVTRYRLPDNVSSLPPAT